MRGRVYSQRVSGKSIVTISHHIYISLFSLLCLALLTYIQLAPLLDIIKYIYIYLYTKFELNSLELNSSLLSLSLSLPVGLVSR